MSPRRGVSVVIPTYRRPGMVPQAVHSALQQTGADLEVIVVVDGRDDATLDVLHGLDDDRLSIVVPPERRGNAGARNAGIERASHEWTALLDDDDLWLPEKLEHQLAAAERSPHDAPIVSCKLEAFNERRSFVWPRRLPRDGQPLSEYLFCRRSPGTGEGMVQTSTILAPTKLFREVPFDASIRRYVDLDWVLRAGRRPDVGLAFVEEDAPFVRWRIEPDRARVSNEAGWLWDVAWIRHRRHLVTPRAHAAFLLTLCSTRAARDRDLRALPYLLRSALREHRPSAAELAFHMGNFALPFGVKDRLAGWSARRSA